MDADLIVAVAIPPRDRTGDDLEAADPPMISRQPFSPILKMVPQTKRQPIILLPARGHHRFNVAHGQDFLSPCRLLRPQRVGLGRRQRGSHLRRHEIDLQHLVPETVDRAGGPLERGARLIAVDGHCARGNETGRQREHEKRGAQAAHQRFIGAGRSHGHMRLTDPSHRECRSPSGRWRGRRSRPAAARSGCRARPG